MFQIRNYELINYRRMNRNLRKRLMSHGPQVFDTKIVNFDQNRSKLTLTGKVH